MTLKQWLKQPGAKTHRPTHMGGLIGIHDVPAINAIRWELWSLSDYRVESVRAGMIWLARKARNSKMTQKRKPTRSRNSRRRQTKNTLPSNRLIPCEGVVLDSKGRVKKIKIRENDLRRLRNPQTEYVVYPDGSVYSTLAKAKSAAKRLSKDHREPHQRVERTKDNKTVARFEYGKQV